MSAVDVKALARELMHAHLNGQIIAIPPSSRDSEFDLTTAYAVEAELVRLRQANGRRTVGRKVGFANKALWRMLKLDTLVWATMYDDTVRFAEDNAATLSLAHKCSPKIEPEIVFKIRKPIGAGELEPAAVLDAVEWLALGFEIIDCVFADWTFQPADFVAAFGFHTALVVGEPRRIESGLIPALVEQLMQTRPGIKVIYISGYTNNAVITQGRREYAITLLQKPFSLDVLLHTMRGVLDAGT